MHIVRAAVRAPHLLSLIALSLLTVVTTGRLEAQEAKAAAKAPAAPKVFQCRFATDPIVIDGKADEAAWKHAELIDQFTLPWLQDKIRPPKTSTKARLLWDRDSIYFFAEMEDTDLYADVKEHDGMTWDNDVFELFFKPADDKPGYYEFQVNAANTVMDMFIPRRGTGGYGRYKKDGDFHLEAKVVLKGTLNQWTDKDQGWTVEGKLPWTDFLRTGGRPDVGERWKFALCRYDYSVDFEGPDLSTCAPLNSRPFADFHHYEDYATLEFVGPQAKQSSRPFGIPGKLPLVASKVVGSPDPLPPYRAVRAMPQLKLTHPICVIQEPGSKRLIFVDQKWPYGPSRLCRTTDQPEEGKYDTLLDPKGVAYSLCFHPKFAENGYLYVGSNGEPLTPGATGKHTRIVRYTIGRTAPYALDPKSETLILEWLSDGHNGGAMAFGRDGLLYITSGDGTSDSDTNLKGQGLDHLLSKVLRIDVDHPDAGKTYSVPKDNPFVDRPGARPETWAYGLRNPWRMTCDPVTGAIWVGNNGQDLYEQIYRLEKGANYGWSVMEGGHPFYLDRQAGPTPFVKPTTEHPHSDARSLTGGVVYHGKKLPDLRGAYLYGDYSTGKIWGVRHDGQKVTWHKEIADTTLVITDFFLDDEGEVYVVDFRGSDGGGLYRLEPQPPADASVVFPRTLSASGLFPAGGHKPAAGLIPYSVNAPLWSDGAYKERYIALPTVQVDQHGQQVEEPAGIDFTTNRGWNFANGTVLVKSFALELEEGNPATRKWVETRFMVKQDNEWVGYSYEWNDAQTDAVLVEGAGKDKTFTLLAKDGAGSKSGRQQVWHYPSRTECMVCHSRAANYVLGLTEFQMNKDHDYRGQVPDGAVDNQLRVLEALGVLRVNWHGDASGAVRDGLKKQGLDEKQVNERLQIQTATRDQRSQRTSRLLSKDPAEYRKLVDPYDPKQDLNARARSYLHANCAQCHIEAGGGNARLELEFNTADAKTNLFNETPMHHKFGLTDPRIIAPGAPERSVLLERLSRRGPGQMPQLATNVVDREAVELFKAWIKQLEKK